MTKYSEPGLAYHPIQLADDIGYAGWYSTFEGAVAGYRLFDGGFLHRDLCPLCRGVPDHNRACKHCNGSGRVTPVES